MTIEVDTMHTIQRWGILVGLGLIALGLAMKAREARAASPADSTVRVTCYGADGKPFCYGSGTLIDVRGESAIVLTNAHVVRDTPEGPFDVTFQDGAKFSAVLRNRNDQWDLAALEIQNKGRPAAKWSGQLAGGSLHSFGYGPEGQLCTVAGQATDSGASDAKMSVAFSAPFTQGDSGGGVFDEAGVMRGVVWATNDTEGVFVHPQRVAEFLGELTIVSWVDDPARAGEMAEAQCYGGSCSPGVAYGNCPGGQCSPGGYSQFGQLQQQVSPRTVVPPPSQSIAPSGCDCGPKWAALESRLANLQSKPGPAGAQGPQGPRGPAGEAAQVDVAAIAAQAAAIAARQAPPPPDTSRLATKDEVEAADASLFERIKAVGSVVASGAAAAHGGHTGLVAGLGWGKLLAATLGVSGPIGLGIVAAAALGGRRLKRRRRQATRTSGGGGRRGEPFRNY